MKLVNHFSWHALHELSNPLSESLSIFLNLVGIGLFAAVSTSSLKKLENKVDDTIALYQQQQDRKVKDKAANISITPGGDETFFENSMVLVCMDLASGFIFNETISEKRDHKSWEQTTTPWLSKFKVHRCFLSDKAKALLKLAKTTLKVTRIPDLFHMMNDVCKVKRVACLSIDFALPWPKSLRLNRQVFMPRPSPSRSLRDLASSAHY